MLSASHKLRVSRKRNASGSWNWAPPGNQALREIALRPWIECLLGSGYLPEMSSWNWGPFWTRRIFITPPPRTSSLLASVSRICDMQKMQWFHSAITKPQEITPSVLLTTYGRKQPLYSATPKRHSGLKRTFPGNGVTPETKWISETVCLYDTDCHHEIECIAESLCRLKLNASLKLSA